MDEIQKKKKRSLSITWSDREMMYEDEKTIIYTNKNT